jgi:hypothetical protein
MYQLQSDSGVTQVPENGDLRGRDLKVVEASTTGAGSCHVESGGHGISTKACSGSMAVAGRVRGREACGWKCTDPRGFRFLRFCRILPAFLVAGFATGLLR